MSSILVTGATGTVDALTGSQALDYYEVARVFTEVLGRTVVYANPSAPRFVRTARGRSGFAAYTGDARHLHDRAIGPGRHDHRGHRAPARPPADHIAAVRREV